MTTLENIIQDFRFGTESLTHRKAFLSSKSSSNRSSWYSRRRFV